jgi:phosphoglucosamine mutase
MKKYFGTDGVRGIVNKDLTSELACKLGKAAMYVLPKKYNNEVNDFVFIGKDTRRSGDMLFNAISSGITSMGYDVVNLDIATTPEVAYLTKKYKALCGVVISASHNPPQYNGIKFFSSQGYKLSDDTEEEIESYIEKDLQLSAPTLVGRVLISDIYKNDYLSYLKEIANVDMKGIRVAIDAGNGAAYQLVQSLFTSLGAEVKMLNNTPDGVNINVDCGATKPEVLSTFMKENNFDFGFTFDGDADRCLMVDELGNILDGDEIIAIMSNYFYKNNLLNNNSVVMTVMSNKGLEQYLNDRGIELLRASVGDKYVLEKMLENESYLGGEQSGHIIIRYYATTGDGLLTAVVMSKIIVESGLKLSKIRSGMKVYPQFLLNVYVEDKSIINDSDYQKCVESYSKLINNGRLFVRASGTENKIRILVEGEDEEEIKNIAKKLADETKKFS